METPETLGHPHLVTASDSLLQGSQQCCRLPPSLGMGGPQAAGAAASLEEPSRLLPRAQTRMPHACHKHTHIHPTPRRQPGDSPPVQSLPVLMCAELAVLLPSPSIGSKQSR